MTACLIWLAAKEGTVAGSCPRMRAKRIDLGLVAQFICVCHHCSIITGAIHARVEHRGQIVRQFPLGKCKGREVLRWAVK